MAKSLREMAMDMLARREHSAQEVRQKLLAKEVEADNVEQVVQDLIKDNLISDERFTEAFVNQRINRGSGPLKIRAELRQKGISDAMIAEFINERDDVWRETAAEVRIKKYGATFPSDLKEKARQARFLQSRGFSSEHTRYAIREFE